MKYRFDISMQFDAEDQSDADHKARTFMHLLINSEVDVVDRYVQTHGIDRVDVIVEPMNEGIH